MDDITVGEVSRRILSLERNMEKRLDDLRAELRDMQFVHKDVYERDQHSIWQAIGEINEKDKRRTAWVATGIILPVLLIIFLQVLQLK